MTISNRDDTIDSREVIDRIEELTDERTALVDAIEEARENYEAAAQITHEIDADDPDGKRELEVAVEKSDDAKELLDEAKEKLEAWNEENDEELLALEALAKEAANYAVDWQHGEALIRDSYFKEYAQELAADIGAIDSEAKWPNTCIDWDQAARELQEDYTAVEFGDVTYWVR